MKLRSMRNFGFTDYDKVSYIGTDGKLSKIFRSHAIDFT